MSKLRDVRSESGDVFTVDDSMVDAAPATSEAGPFRSADAPLPLAAIKPVPAHEPTPEERREASHRVVGLLRCGVAVGA